jgi:uncharacterized membrane protein
MNKNRLEAFSDGVFAIVITLLVLEIKVPHIEIEQLAHALFLLMPKFFSFALSFIIIGVYWIAHHNMMHFITKTDRGALWLNILVLFTICIIPFPTALIGDYPTAIAGVIFYGVTLTAVNLSGTIFWLYCTTNNRLVADNLNPEFSRKVAILHFSPVLFYLLAIIFSFISVKISYTIYIGVPLFFIIPNKFLKKLFLNPYL